MSAFGTKRTFQQRFAMSAFGGIADIAHRHSIEVEGPALRGLLFDDLAGRT